MTFKTKKRIFRTAYTVSAVFTVCSTILLTREVTTYITTRNYQRKVQNFTLALQQRLDTYNDVLYSLRAYAANEYPPTEKQWNDFIKNQALFERFSDLNSISYNEVVTHEQLPAYLQRIRSDRSVRDNSQVAVKPPGRRDKYVLATFYTSRIPSSKNQKGADFYSEPTRRAAFDMAAARKVPTSTPPVTLFNSKAKGFFITIPVQWVENKKTVTKAYINVVFHAERTVDKLLRPYIKGEHTTLKIDDVTDDSEAVLYAEKPPSPLYRPLVQEAHIKVGGRKWRLTFTTGVLRQQDRFIIFLPLIIGAFTLVIIVQPSLYRLVDRRLASRKQQLK